MVKNEKEQKVVLKERYSFEMLLNDIKESAFCDDETQGDDQTERERKSKLIVIQMLIDKANEYEDDAYRDDEKLRNAIDVKVNGDVYLSGYIFYISQNPQFDYSWNYLRKSESKYKEFLIEGIRFLDNVLVDINMLVGKKGAGKDIHVEINDLFDVSLVKDAPYVKCRVLWKNFHRLSMIKRDYNFTVKSKDCILLSGSRKKSSDAENIINEAIAMINVSVVKAE